MFQQLCNPKVSDRFVGSTQGDEVLWRQVSGWAKDYGLLAGHVIEIALLDDGGHGFQVIVTSGNIKTPQDRADFGRSGEVILSNNLPVVLKW